MTAARCYPDGSPRPLVRGWLHALLACVGFLWGASLIRNGDPRLELIFMVLAKSISLSTSAHLHIVEHHTPLRYAIANAMDFFCLPYNGGSVLAILTPRSKMWLRMLHTAVIVSVSVSVLRPVFNWTLLVCKKEMKAAERPHMQRTLLSVMCGIWIYASWIVQEGFSLTWLGYLVFLCLGYLFWNMQHLGVKPMPWHGEWWAAHDDFHVFGVFADACVFAHALPASAAMAAA